MAKRLGREGISKVEEVKVISTIVIRWLIEVASERPVRVRVVPVMVTSDGDQ